MWMSRDGVLMSAQVGKGLEASEGVEYVLCRKVMYFCHVPKLV